MAPLCMHAYRCGMGLNVPARRAPQRLRPRPPPPLPAVAPPASRMMRAPRPYALPRQALPHPYVCGTAPCLQGASRLLTANAGDARIILLRGGKPVVLTEDHVPGGWGWQAPPGSGQRALRCWRW